MLLLGDCLEQMKTLEDNSVDAVVTDPPAGISFMQKAWDGDKGGRDHWIKWMSEIMSECNRVLKPGGHALVWGLPRTSHWTATAIENAGFEIRDVCTHIFGSGFPKSHNIKDGEFTGWGTALKPASEHWILCRKKLSEKTVKDNVARWGTGAINIDGTRIEAADQDKLAKNWDRDQSETMASDRPAYGKFGAIDLRDRAPQGRWPANVLFDEDAAKGKEWARFFYVAKASKAERNRGCEGMPEKISTKQFMKGTSDEGNNVDDSIRKFADPVNQNFHPTVKPIKLMEYLITLITPPNGTVLDPFMGSGSTGVAARNLKRNFIGIERDPEYMEIAKRRIEA